MKKYNIYAIWYGRKTLLLTVDYIWQAGAICRACNKNDRKNHRRQRQGYIYEEVEA